MTEHHPYRARRPPLDRRLRELRAILTRQRASRVRPPADMPRGDGSAVLLLPPILLDDHTTAWLRHHLDGAGYRTNGWELGTNWGPTPGLIAGAERRLDALYARHGRIRLVGLSMGGLFARHLALERPHQVRQIITVCSPFRDPLGSFWLDVRPFLPFWGGPDVLRRAQALAGPIDVPCHALYTESDGVVAWESCRDPASPGSNIRFAGSHVTIARSPVVLGIVARLLAGLQEGQLQI